MNTDRLEAFSDGVFAVIITIMVLELKVPASADLHAVLPQVPVFITYVVSFVNVGIYWNNHHHLLRATERIDGRIMWSNLFLLFWLSLLPLTTGWAGQNHFQPLPTAAYCFDLLMCAVGFWLLTSGIVHLNGPTSRVSRIVGDGRKERISLIIYVVAFALSFVEPIGSAVLVVVVAAIWFIPDGRFEVAIESTPS